jgi:hypothetical protein
MITREKFNKNEESLKFNDFKAVKLSDRSEYVKLFLLDVSSWDIAQEMRFLSSDYTFKIKRSTFFKLELIIYILDNNIKT